MNGFTKTIISLTLSWIKQIFNSIWGFFNSPNSNLFLNLISKYWLFIVIVICVSGVLFDWILYLIRWRPHYVWFGRKKQTKYNNKDSEFYNDDSYYIEANAANINKIYENDNIENNNYVYQNDNQNYNEAYSNQQNNYRNINDEYVKNTIIKKRRRDGNNS